MKESTKVSITTIVFLTGLILMFTTPFLVYKFGGTSNYTYYDRLFTLTVGVPGAIMFLGSFIYFCAKGWYAEIAELEHQANLRED